jgi:protein involved in polysaccharide export with SLBB domain
MAKPLQQQHNKTNAVISSCWSLRFVTTSLFLPVAVLLFVLSGCTATSRVYTQKSEKLPPLPELIDESAFVPWKTASDSIVSPGYEIEISSPVDETIKGTFRIGKDSLLKLPYQVEVNASGLSVPALTSAINRSYSRLLVNPNIAVSVVKQEYYVEIGGLVNRPGVYPIPKSASLDELIAHAKGLQVGSDQQPRAQFARITQGDITNTIRLQDYYSGQPGLLPTWRGGEKVFLQYTRTSLSPTGSSASIRLVGQIKNPGEYRFQDGKDVYDYMILAGGPTEKANMDNLTLIRGLERGERETISFSLQQSETIPALRSGDVIMFQADNPSQLQKDAQTVGGFSGFFSSLAGVLAMIGLAF